jgi:hypothetical protein
LEKIKDVFPTNRIKSFANIELEEKCGDLCFVESRGKVLYIEEVVVNTPSLNEGTLSIGDKAIHERIEMICKHLCNDFSDGVD